MSLSLRLSALRELTTRTAQIAAGIQPMRVTINTRDNTAWIGFPAPKRATGGNRIASKYNI